MKVGFAGSGNMAAAIARGWVLVDAPVEMLFTDSGSGRAQALADETGGRRLADLRELAAESEIIVLAVKPKALLEAGAGLEGFDGPVISLLNGTPLASLREALPSACVLRTMPNLGVELGSGQICHAPPDDAGVLAPCLELLARVATLYELPEEHLDAATAVMGCSLGWIALACDAISEAGAAAGLDPELAAELIARSTATTGELLQRHGPGDLQAAVASPGGSTEAGLEELDAREARAAYGAAVKASLERMAGTR